MISELNSFLSCMLQDIPDPTSGCCATYIGIKSYIFCSQLILDRKRRSARRQTACSANKKFSVSAQLGCFEETHKNKPAETRDLLHTNCKTQIVKTFCYLSIIQTWHSYCLPVAAVTAHTCTCCMNSPAVARVHTRQFHSVLKGPDFIV